MPQKHTFTWTEGQTSFIHITLSLARGKPPHSLLEISIIPLVSILSKCKLMEDLAKPLNTSSLKVFN